MNYEELQKHDKSTTPIHADEVRWTYTSERLQEVIANAEQHDPALVERCEQRENRYKPSVLQTVVAVGLGLSLFYNFFSFINIFVRIDLPTNLSNFFRYSYESIITTICFGVLYFKANNHATKIALILGIALCIIKLLSLSLHINIPYVPYFVPIFWAYLYGIIIMNNNLDNKSKIWINTLFVTSVIMTMISQGIYLAEFLAFDKKEISDYFFNSNYRVSSSLIYLVSRLIIINIFQVIGYWYFARCEAFSGNHETGAKYNYSPLNKWMAAAIIVTLIVAISLFVLYKNYEMFIY